MPYTSLYTDIALFFFLIIGERVRANAKRNNERGAQERKIKNVCSHLWEKELY